MGGHMTIGDFYQVKHTHEHNHCSHANLKFCTHCQVPYCKDCGHEWGRYNTWYSNPYYGQGLGGNTTIGYSHPDPQKQTITTTAGSTCSHT